MKPKTIELMMGDRELVFIVNLEDYNQCVNALQTDNKVAPMHNFLTSVAANEATLEAVKEAFELALTTDLFGAVIKEYKPDVEITVKKFRPELVKSKKTDSPS